MTDYKKYLKVALVGDGKIITYRQLSRELKVHVNAAKEMLYDFHRDLNLRKPSSCHATYTLSGLRRPSTYIPGVSDGVVGMKDAEGDEVMQSSPFGPSSQISVPMESAGEAEEGGAGSDASGKGREGKELVKSIVLVPEERLGEVKSTFEILLAIHIYSIEPTSMSDMLLLADNTLEVVRLDLAEPSPQDIARKYGGIMNSHAKRRVGAHRVIPSPDAPAAPAATVVKQAPISATPTEKKKSMIGNGAGSRASTVANNSGAGGAQGKRAQADFFKAFGGGTKKRDSKLEDESAPVLTAASVKPNNCEPVKPSFPTLKSRAPLPQTEDNTVMELDNETADYASEPPRKRHPDNGPEEPPLDQMQDSDDEEDSYMSPPLAKKRSSITEQHAQRKKERQEELRKMMEDSDDDSTPASKQAAVPCKKDDYDYDDLDEIPTSAQKPPAAATDVALSSKAPPGRRRGRRKVNKRISTRDKEGYLVVSHEMAWESYSEDEAVAPIPLTPTPTAQKPKVEKEKEKEDLVLDGGKKKRATVAIQKKIGQGNIMNFFGKK